MRVPDKGRVTLLITGAICISALFFSGDLRSFLFICGTTGFIGCWTNTLAIRMLFDRIYLLPGTKRWPMPCSGILEHKRVEVARGIGWVVSRQLLSPKTLLKNFGSENFQALTNEIISEKLQQIAEDAELLDNLVEDMEKCMVYFAESDIFRHKLQQSLYPLERIERVLDNALDHQDREKWTVKLMGKLKDKLTGFRDREKITPHLQKEVKKIVGYICSDAVFKAVLKDFLKNLQHKLTDLESPFKQDMQRYSNLALKQFVERVEIDKMVEEEVRSFPPGVLRDLMYRITADNLQWLEVWGGILGALGGVLFWFVSKLVYL